MLKSALLRFTFQRWVFKMEFAPFIIPLQGHSKELHYIIIYLRKLIRGILMM